jgi:pyruvate carboxylase subunit B
VLEPGIPAAKAILEKEGLSATDENIFIVGALATPGGNKGLDFLKGNKPVNIRKVTKEEGTKKAPEAVVSFQQTAHAGPSAYTVTVEGKAYQVTVAESSGQVTAIAPAAQAGVKPAAFVEVKAKLHGIVYEILVKEGDPVRQGQTLIILEAMKMETPVVAPADGTVETIAVEKGNVVKTDQLVAILV